MVAALVAGDKPVVISTHVFIAGAELLLVLRAAIVAKGSFRIVAVVVGAILAPIVEAVVETGALFGRALIRAGALVG